MKELNLRELLDLAGEHHPELDPLIQEVRGQLDEVETMQPRPDQRVLAVQEGVAALTQAIHASLAQSNSVVICVAGPTGSGKTSVIAEKLAAEVSDSLILSTDHFYTGDKAMIAASVPNWDHPAAVDLDSANRVIMELAAGRKAEAPVYSKTTHEPDGTQWIDPQRLIIVEGLFVLDGRIQASPGMGVYVHVPFLECMRRRVRRDVLENKLAGRTLETELKYLWETVRRMHYEHVKPTAESAAWIITNDSARV
ncbi:MAG: hypothetical protein AAB383_00750 [Patescibacteria group bacterium]